MSSAAASERLREANRKIESYLTGFSRAPVRGSGREREALEELHVVLTSVGGAIGGGLRGSEIQAADREEFIRYRNNLVRLHAVLRRMHGDALALRSAVLKHQCHLDLTRRWYDASLASTPDGGGAGVPARTRAGRRPSLPPKH